MNQTIFVVLLVLALLGTFFVVRLGVVGSFAGQEVNNRLGVVLSAGLLILWGVIAINAFEVTVVSGGSEFTSEYKELVWIAIAGGGVTLYSLFQAAVEEIRATGGV